MDMSAELQSLARGGSRGGGGGSGGFGHHAFGTVAGYALQDGSTKERPNYNDQVLVDLQRPTLGIDASPANPVRIAVTIEPPKSTANPKRTPLAVIHVAKGRGSADPTQVGDFLMLKDIKRDGDIFKARRVEVAVREFDAQKHFVWSGHFSIRPERLNKPADGSKPYYSQLRIGLVTDWADVVNSIEHFRERAIAAFNDAAGIHGSRPHVVLRGIQQNAEGKHHFSIARELSLYDFAAKREYTPEEAVDRFISGEDGDNGPAILKYVGGDSIMFEVIPQFRVNTGGASLPSAKKENAEEKGGPVAPEDMWKYDDGHGQRFEEDGQVLTGYSAMDIVLQRLQRDNGDMGNTHNIFAQPQRPVQPLFKLAEVVTPNLSPELAADLVRRADELGKTVRQANKAPKAPAAAAQEPEQQQDDYAAPPPGFAG